MSKIKNTHTTIQKKSYWQWYTDFCDRQMEQRILWYVIPFITLVSVIMPISIFFMFYFKGYILFMTISGLLFYINVVLNIGEVHTKSIISLYICTVLYHILTPLFSFFSTLF